MKRVVVKFPEFKQTMKLRELDLSDDWEDCDLCEDLERSRSQVVHGSGHLDADLLICGEGPGNEEDLEGVPFIGDSGGLLNQLLIVNDMTREDVFVDNLVPCRPLHVVDGRKAIRPPTKVEITNCLPRLYQTILEVDPILIVAMGRPVLHTLTKDSSLTIQKTRGEVYIIRIPGVFKMVEYPIVVSQHPAFILRNPSEAKYSPKWYLVRDFVFASRLLKLARKLYRR